MRQRPLARRRRSMSVTPKQIALALFVIGVFLLIVMMLGQANNPG